MSWITCGDLTFLEAFKKTGRILNISLSTIAAKSPPILLNYITAPDILIKSAVICSASAPGLLNPGYLRSKKPDGSIEVLKEQYFDGSMEQVCSVTLFHLNFVLFICASHILHPHIHPMSLGYSQGWIGRADELPVLCGCTGQSPSYSLPIQC